MVRFRFALIALALAASPVFAAKPVKSAAPTAAAPVEAAAVVGGPVGLGGIKLGLTKAEIDALPDDAPVRLAAPMADYVYTDKIVPTPGDTKYKATLLTPFSKSPLDTVLTFREEKLARLHVTLKDGQLEDVKRQISEKYGAPAVENGQKEEQCIYRNGNSFAIKSGNLKYTWIAEKTPAGRVETTLNDLIVAVCPADLRHGMHPFAMQGLVITNEPPKPKAANAF